MTGRGRPPRRGARRRPAATPAKALLGSLTAVSAALSVAGCARPSATCTVRHHYAIVIFQDGVGESAGRTVTRFRLNVDYGAGNVERWLIRGRIVLAPEDGANPPVIVRTYPVGRALGCRVDQVRTRM